MGGQIATSFSVSSPWRGWRQSRRNWSASVSVRMVVVVGGETVLVRMVGVGPQTLSVRMVGVGPQTLCQ